ncbi:hypothetical protein IQ247_05010 [Plectonema cf. radiosum LEGE 06105]|uniref:Heme oxygenase n=1 Tax=Plectonema cf. radiosum LEGE 06105 TaxID=945769 RepID=A0A8J7F2U8_9CYAN|nr:hypothetical protein [Plectonema radiosum]MBE9212075.1 hypothetical protein [Plectonema cf. radiosum LEGE 06105]
MQEILSLIEEKNQEYALLPLFKFLEDKTINPRQRLSFAPCIAHFIMSFGDLNKYVFREKQVLSKVQDIINEHTYEDDHHWPWFVTDLEKLGFNPQMNFTQVLRYLWSEQSKVSRQLSYQLSAYTLQAEPIIKIAAIEAIEATGYVLFSRTAQVASELTEITGEKYTYFGDFHFNLENGHAMGTEGGEAFLATLDLTESQRQQAYEVVENVFSIFTEWTHELLAYAQKQNAELELYKEIENSAKVCV